MTVLSLVCNIYVGLQSGQSSCLLRKWSGVPCPSCGGSRAILLLLKGDFSASLAMNPNGALLVLCCMALLGIAMYDFQAAVRKTARRDFLWPGILFFLLRPDRQTRRRRLLWLAMLIAAVVLEGAVWMHNIRCGI